MCSVTSNISDAVTFAIIIGLWLCSMALRRHGNEKCQNAVVFKAVVFKAVVFKALVYIARFRLLARDTGAPTMKMESDATLQHRTVIRRQDQKLMNQASS